MHYLLNIAIAILIMAANIAHADTTLCYTPSPNLSTLGDDYYDLENTITLATSTQNQMKDLFNNITGKWQGQMHQTECRGPDRAPTIKSREANVAANIKLNAATSLSIQGKKHNQAQKIKKTEQLTLLGNRPTFDLDITIGQRLVFAERYRLINQLKNKATPVAETNALKKLFNRITGSRDNSTTIKKPKSTRMMEIIYDLNLRGNLLMFTRSYYTNGVFTGREQWQLSRD